MQDGVSSLRGPWYGLRDMGGADDSCVGRLDWDGSAISVSGIGAVGFACRILLWQGYCFVHDNCSGVLDGGMSVQYQVTACTPSQCQLLTAPWYLCITKDILHRQHVVL